MSVKLILPKVYENENGNYPQHKGKPKLSHSQYTSWIDPKYNAEYRAHYFADGPRSSNAYSDFGGECGKWLETSGKEVGTMLSDRDISVLNSIERHPDARYEVEVVIDRGNYCIQGFIDYEVSLKGGLDLRDYKTGDISKKAEFYESEEYQQTTLYAYQRKQEGKEILYSGVVLLDRKGNPWQDIPLSLTGDVLEIETLYSDERAEEFLKKIDKVAKEIARGYKVFLELQKLK